MEVEDNDGLEKADVDVVIEPAVGLYSDDRGSGISDVTGTMCGGGLYTLSGCWLPAIIMLRPTCTSIPKGPRGPYDPKGAGQKEQLKKGM